MASVTPNAVDTFTRWMAPMFDDKIMITIAKGFQAFFGRPETGAQTLFSPDANDVDIDIIRGNKKIAALIPRGMVSRPLGTTQQNVSAEKYSSFSRKYPLSEEEGDISADQITNRMAGENPYSNMSRQQRLRVLAAKMVRENIRRTGDMFEVLAAQSILTGKMDAIIGTSNTDLQYDFRRNATHTVTVGTVWTNPAATILSDIDSMADKIKQDGRVIPDFLGIGSTGMGGLLKNTEILALADNRRIELVQISRENPVPPQFNRFVEAGWLPFGSLRTPKGYNFWLFTYQDYYENSAGTVVKFLGDTQAIMASSKARCDRYFGPPEMLPMTTSRRQMYQDYFGFSMDAPPMPMDTTGGGIIVPEMFYHDAYETGNGKRISIRTQSAPIFATTHTDAFGTLNGLG